ncbi:MAG TPA: hypothetical protein DEQ68_01570 [Ruminococcaceae bacterium]|nr:hypothetical protein [Oscillospiraceae bacterium]
MAETLGLIFWGKVLQFCLTRTTPQGCNSTVTKIIQYTSHSYFNLTQLYGITQSMSSLGNPYDNALAENFFSILKTECIYRTKLNSFSEARHLIDDYIYFYNHQRIQLKTKLTPLELRSQFFA